MKYSRNLQLLQMFVSSKTLWHEIIPTGGCPSVLAIHYFICHVFFLCMPGMSGLSEFSVP